MLPSEIPIFPLPNVALFPSALLPLHIFEPRYRAMVGDVLDGERLIGMVMLRPGWEPHYEATPAVYAVGCAGFITHAERMADGRYNLLLRGMERFRIQQERRVRTGVELYRVAEIESIPEPPVQRGSTALCNARKQLERLIAKRLHKSAAETIPEEVSDEDLVHAIAQHLDPLEKQALLECDGLLRRLDALIELLEMQMMEFPQAGKTRFH